MDPFRTFCGDVGKLSQPAQSRIIASVTDALACRAGNYIAFGRYDSLPKTKAKFARVASIPNCIRCIDCTHYVHLCAKREQGRLRELQREA